MSFLDEISNYNLQKIVSIEENDRQFLALKKCWKNINQIVCPLYNKNQVGNFFLFMVLQNSLISYQIAGSGEQRWEEFAGKLEFDFADLFRGFLMGNTSEERFYNLMTTSRYNKRLYNLKIGRIRKISEFRRFLTSDDAMYLYYKDMNKLRESISKIMKTHRNSKTIVFAIKMFGYAARVAFDEYVQYPMNIPIPVDSRIKKIFIEKYGKMTDKQILSKAQKLSERFGIPPLHLDALLRVKR